MSFPLQEFEVSFELDAPAELLIVCESRQEAERWTLYDLKTWDGYAAALVVERNDHSISHTQWTYTQFS
jgi:hypothetical protein